MIVPLQCPNSRLTHRWSRMLRGCRLEARGYRRRLKCAVMPPYVVGGDVAIKLLVGCVIAK